MPHEMLVGILAGDNDRSGSFYGNISLFKAIQRHLTEQNSSSFVFTPSGMKEKSIVGYIYEPNENLWLKKSFYIQMLSIIAIRFAIQFKKQISFSAL